MSIGSENRSSQGSPLDVLRASLRPGRAISGPKPALMVAGATGALGSEVLRRLAGSGGFAHTQVLAREPMATGLAQVLITQVPDAAIDTWPASARPADTGVVMFEPPRLYHDRERALWTPAPSELVALARWLHRSGVQTLVVVLPHDQGSLPLALRHGLASVDEQQVTALGFERVLLVRAARKPVLSTGAGFLDRTAAWMLSVLKYMIPASSLPVRPARLAEFVEAVLPVLPPGTHVAGTELLWQGGKPQNMRSVVQAWLNTRLQAD